MYLKTIVNLEVGHKLVVWYLCYMYLKIIVNLEVVHKLSCGIYVICI